MQGEEPQGVGELGAARGHLRLPEAALQIPSKGFEKETFACLNRIIFTSHRAPLLAKTPFYF